MRLRWQCGQEWGQTSGGIHIKDTNRIRKELSTLSGKCEVYISLMLGQLVHIYKQVGAPTVPLAVILESVLFLVKSYQIMLFMSKHAIHIKTCNACQNMQFISNCVIHVTIHGIHDIPVVIHVIIYVHCTEGDWPVHVINRSPLNLTISCYCMDVWLSKKSILEKIVPGIE
jgi:hypothetical protein